MTVDYAPPQPGSTMRRDIVSAYAASGMKVLSWAVAAALIYRFDQQYFAIFALVRGTLSLLNYTTLGVAPAIVRYLSIATGGQPATMVAGSPSSSSTADNTPAILGYESPVTPPAGDATFQASRVCYSALLLAVVVGGLGSLLAWGLSYALPQTMDLTQTGAFWTWYIVFGLGIGLAARLASDVCGAILQAYHKITADNTAMAAADLLWIALMVWQLLRGNMYAFKAAEMFAVSSCGLLVVRTALVAIKVAPPRVRLAFFDAKVVFGLLGFGLLVSLAQLADFLYAPTDYWLIKQLIGLETITTYAPAVQIDGAMLLLVGGLAAVLLPKAAAAHVRGNVDALRIYYVRGTLASLAMLLAAGLVVWIASPWIFRLWLGDAMPATQVILPLVLIHTVVGGSSAVGRSVLLGMGKVWPFTVAALVAGVANVILSATFVAGFGWGLKGIVLGTIVAVVGRCAIWQPWYVWRCLRRVGFNPPSDAKAVG